MKAKRFLFIGGPHHAQWNDVDPVVPVDPSVFAAVGDDGQPVAPAETDDVYPTTLVIIDHATHYTKRQVGHADGNTGDTYYVNVYVWEGVTDGADASLHLGDAVAHRWFLDNGKRTPAIDAPAKHRLIIPGR